jgi:hypothetical protein
VTKAITRLRHLQAKEETEEAIQAGNHRFNAMLHERMGAEERLAAQIEQLKLEVAGRERDAAALREERARAEDEGRVALARGERAGEEQRRALQAQLEQARARHKRT